MEWSLPRQFSKKRPLMIEHKQVCFETTVYLSMKGRFKKSTLGPDAKYV